MEKKPGHRRDLPLVLGLLWGLIWGLICLFMVLSAVIGLGCVAFGTVSLFVDLSGLLEMALGGEVVQTTAQKILFAAFGAVMAGCGIGFWWQSRRGHPVRALIFCTVLMGLILVLGLVTGQRSVISVSGPRR
jgi:hypothetical protein